MNKILIIFYFIIATSTCWGQSRVVVEKLVTKFTLPQSNDTIEFVVVDTALTQKKPVFLWCQGSLPYPLFCEIENHGFYFFGGGVSNFDYRSIAKDYHLVIIAMPKTPVLARKENLNQAFQYVPDKDKPYTFSSAFVEADYLDNYVSRASAVLDFLRSTSWVSPEKLIVAGHSQGSKVATKIARTYGGVTHVGLFAANPFGRTDQFVREARVDAQAGKISWQKADSLMNDQYTFYREIHDENAKDPSLKAWRSFSETFYDDWLSLDIPIYLAYGTEDRTADLCDIVPLFFIEKHKNNLTLQRYLGLEHNFFEVLENGKVNYEKAHWKEVMEAFVGWIK